MNHEKNCDKSKYACGVYHEEGTPCITIPCTCKSSTPLTQEKQYNCRFHPTDGWHEVGCPHTSDLIQEEGFAFAEVWRTPKPTQDTESWEKKFDKKFRALMFVDGIPMFNSSVGVDDIKDFIKQKKQEWEKCEHRARWEVVQEERLTTARTQGAEAAVKKIISNSPIVDPVHALGDLKYYRVSSELLEEAKKV